MAITKNLKGTINFSFHGTTKFSKEEKYRTVLTTNNFVDDDVKEEYKDAKMLPKWLNSTEEKIDISISSKFDFPVKMEDDTTITFSDFLDMGQFTDTEVIFKVNIKDGALYPKAMKVVKMGKKFDPFEDMN